VTTTPATSSSTNAANTTGNNNGPQQPATVSTHNPLTPQRSIITVVNASGCVATTTTTTSTGATNNTNTITNTITNPNQLVSTTNSSTSSYSYNPNGTVEEYLIETHLIEPAQSIMRAPKLGTNTGGILASGGSSSAIPAAGGLSPLEEDDAASFTVPPVGELPVDELDNEMELELFFDKKTRRRQRLKLKREQQQQLLDEDERIIFCTSSQINWAIGSCITLAVMLAFPQLFAYEIKQNVVSVSPSALPTPPIPANTSDQSLDNAANQAALNEFNRMYENIYFIEEDRPTRVGGWFGIGTRTDSFLSFSYAKSVSKALGFSVRINADTAYGREVLQQMKRTHAKFFSFKEYFRLATNQYDYCHMLKNSHAPGKNEQSEYDLSTMNKVVVMLSKILFQINFINEDP
jgi:hypothetical protein